MRTLKYNIIEYNHLISGCHTGAVEKDLLVSASLPVPHPQEVETCRLQSPLAGQCWDNENASCAIRCLGGTAAWLPQGAALSAHLNQKSQETIGFEGSL